MKRYAIYLIFGVICFTWIYGCGYTTRSLIADKYKTIAIPPFSTSIDIAAEPQDRSGLVTYRPALENDITKRVIDRFVFDGNLRLAKQDNADLVLKGDLTDYSRDPVRYDKDDNVEEYRVSITVNASLLDRNTNKIVWDDKDLTGDTTYFLTGPNAKSEEAAVNDALDDLARRIVERTVDSW